jgi:uncharacterized membrane protein (DUF106 family)
MEILDSILSVFYGLFDAIFGRFFPARGDEIIADKIYTEYILGVILVALTVAIFITGIHYLMVDHEKMKKIRKEVSEYRTKVLKAQKEGNKKQIRKLELQKKRINELNAKMTTMSFKPMIFTMIPIFILFAWFRHSYAYGVPILELPFALFDLPVIGTIFGYFHGSMPANQLGAFGWYFLSTTVCSQLLRKILNMD